MTTPPAPPSPRRNVRVPVAATVIASALLASGLGLAWTVQAAAPTPTTVTREPLAQAAAPVGAPHRTLGLSRVTVMPGTKLASHHHPGTQIAWIASGTLTYSVETGSVRVMKGSSEDPTFVRRIRAGETARLRSGRWITEQPSEIHHAENRGTVPVVIYLSTLFRTGAPTSIPD